MGNQMFNCGEAVTSLHTKQVWGTNHVPHPALFNKQVNFLSLSWMMIPQPITITK
uniref:Uncharacterized protein n=1 Tax=Virgibacillus oceani TaxID=1479511 RepID=A0A917HSU4_9BACI|nr:hypothetical protein GCM10011398_37930 [Virgibacillus oceani]